MIILIYAFSAVFFFLAAMMMFAFYRTRHQGMFLFAFTYGTSAFLTLVMMQPWPLLLGFVFAWALRALGMEPDTREELKRQFPPASKQDSSHTPGQP